jgi:ADP-ribosylglycohydrolase
VVAVLILQVLGILPSFSDTTKVASAAKAICKCTHADTRAVASCVSVAAAVSLMLRGEMGENMNTLISQAVKYAEKEIKDKKYLKELFEVCSVADLGSLNLDEAGKIGYLVKHFQAELADRYTFKTLGCSFFALRYGTDFRKTITEIVMQAGDAGKLTSIFA